MKRRDFIKAGAIFAAGAAARVRGAEGAPNGAPRKIKFAVVGCGGRGTSAAKNVRNACDIINRKFGTNLKAELVACADFFREKAELMRRQLESPDAAIFDGPCGYRKVMETDADYVILATPLNFRPVHFAAAVAAGKHVFAEKGVAVDPAGVRSFIATAKEAEKKRLTVVAGTQRRHSAGCRRVAEGFRTGILSPVLGGEVYWNGAVPWVRARAEGMSNKAYLCNNWLNFCELSGDHICEQHVHNIDIANWFIGRYPKTALGFGGRMRRVSGNQYDFFSVDFDYGEGVHIHSMCRQIDGCKKDVREYFRTKDSVVTGAVAKDLKGARINLPAGEFFEENAYDVEHVDLILSMLGMGPYWNEGETVALSTACGVMGRLSAYTGEIVTLNDILKNDASPFYSMNASPSAVDFEAEGDVPMPALGDGEFPRPGLPWRGLKA